jgi:hypothetical protein
VSHHHHHLLTPRRSASHGRIVPILHIVCLPAAAVVVVEAFQGRIVPTPLLVMMSGDNSRRRRNQKRVGVTHDESVPTLLPVLVYITMMSCGHSVLVRL